MIQQFSFKSMVDGATRLLRKKGWLFILLSMMLILIPLVAGASSVDWFNTLTNGNPAGPFLNQDFSTSNELASDTILFDGFYRQSLDNDYTRFTLTYTAPAEYYSCLFQGAGDLFFFDSPYATSSQQQTIVFDLQNGILDSISSQFTIIFYKSDDDCFVINTVGEGYDDEPIAVDGTNFPDPVFKEYVLTHFDTSQDGYLSHDEIKSVTNIDVAQLAIENIQGLQFFYNLISLNCWQTQINSIDVSQNRALKSLGLDACDLSELDLSNNAELTELFLASNNLINLDISPCKNLEILCCQYNQLTEIDISENTVLRELCTQGNLFQSVDVSASAVLTELVTGSERIRYSYYDDWGDISGTSGFIRVNSEVTVIAGDYISNPLHSHILTENPQVDATCTEPGTEAYWSCDICGKLFSDESAETEIETLVEIPASGHSLEFNDRVEATETEDGTEEYWSCSNCGLLFSDEGMTDVIDVPYVIPATGTGEEITWTLDADGLLTISGTGDLVSHPWESSNVRSVVIEGEIFGIGDEVFSGCSAMTSISIPYSVNYIGRMAFANCSSLSSISLPETCEYIGEKAFYQCSDLTSFGMPEYMSGIGEGAFYECTNLNSIVFPYGSGCILKETFRGCSSLTDITIAEDVSSIEENAFAFCSNLNNVHFLGTQAQWNAITCDSTGNEVISSAMISATGHEQEVAILSFGEGCTEIIHLNRASAYTYDGTAEFLFTPKESGSYIFNSFTEETACDLWCYGNAVNSSEMIYGNCYYAQSDYFYDMAQNSGEIYSVVYAECELEKDTTYRFVVDVSTDMNFGSVTLKAFIEKRGDIHWAIDTDTLIISGSGPINHGFYYEAWPKEIKYVVIENGITGISSKTFFDCYQLLSIAIPDSVISIGDQAFENCTHLTNITIPDGVTSIGNQAFYNCSNLTSITVPNSVTSIGVSVFQNCSSLTSITILGGVTSIGNQAFYNCSNLTSITVPNSVINIGESAFWNCNSLTSITIPDGATSIGDYAFNNCLSLTSITIPDGVISIGDQAFNGYGGVIYAHIGTETAYMISKSHAFRMPGTKYDLRYRHNDSIIRLELATVDKDITECEIVQGVTRIGNSAFSGCTNLTSITIPDDVTSIGDFVFSGCTSLTSITIPDGVTSIGDSVFSGCTSLTSIAIPDGVTSIGDSAFSGCTSLTSITIPDNVISIGDYAFYYCNDLTSIMIPDGVTGISDQAFTGYEGVIYVHIGTETAYMISKSHAFRMPSTKYDLRYRNNDNIISLELTRVDKDITECEILQGVTSIGDYAFDSCTSLTSITIPDGVNSIEGYAFSGCSSLTSIVIPDGVTSIGSSAFSGCSSLTSITIPDGVTSIGESAFYGCSSLTSIRIPAGITSIGDYTFAYCSKLETFTVPDGVFSIGNYVFSGSALTKLEIPESVTTLGNDQGISNLTVYCYSFSDADYWADSLGLNIVYLDEIDISEIREIRLEDDFILGIDNQHIIAFAVFPATEASEVTWTSSNPQIAEVEDGTVVGHQAGNCIITATCGDISESVNVTVYRVALSFELSAVEDWVLARQNYQLSIQNISPSDARTYLTWKSSDETLATVDENGTVKTIKPGDVIISVVSEKGLQCSCLLHLCYPVTAIAFEEMQNVREGEDRQLQTHVTMRTQTCINHLVTFSSSDENIATVDNDGILHAVAAGEVTITARAASSKSATITVQIEHDWGEAAYVWRNDNMALTATRICLQHPDQEETAAGHVTAVIQPPTNSSEGSAVYTATFDNNTFTGQEKTILIPALRDMSVITLPSYLTQIESEAFSGIATEAVIVPDTCVLINANAFLDCKSLIYIRIPTGTDVDGSAFAGCDNIVIDRR